VPFEQHYRALSKRDLSLSNVPTPPSVVIDTNLDADQVQDRQLREAEAHRMLLPVEQRALPFVVKLPEARAGLGVFIVKTEENRSETCAAHYPEVDNMLLQLNHTNAHLQPASIIVQEIVEGKNVAVPMFVPKTGSLIMLCCVDACADDQGHWEGSYIDFSQQSHFKQQDAATIEAVGVPLQKLGYYGLAGVDIMTGLNGEDYIIDLNARLTASHLHGLMKGHFSVDRGFNNVAIISPIVDGNLDLDHFKKNFHAELDEGRIVIVGWCYGQDGGKSMTAIMVGGEDKERLQSLIQRINALKTHSYTTISV
jgi:hypothetical protein